MASAWIVLGTGRSLMRINRKVRPVLVWKEPWDVQAGRPRGDATGRHQYPPPWLPGGGTSDHKKRQMDDRSQPPERALVIRRGRNKFGHIEEGSYTQPGPRDQAQLDQDIHRGSRLVPTTMSRSTCFCAYSFLTPFPVRVAAYILIRTPSPGPSFSSGLPPPVFCLIYGRTTTLCCAPGPSDPVPPQASLPQTPCSIAP